MVKKLLIITSLFFFYTLCSYSGVTDSLYSESLGINNTGMMILGSWSLMNIGTGIYGWKNNNGESKYFHQMNFFWNTINLGIASFALYNNYNTDILLMSDSLMVSEHLFIKKVLAINAVLDLAYIGTGVFLNSRANYSTKKADLYGGYGKSIILQGSFLLIFDSIMYFLMDDIDLINSGNVKIAFDHFSSSIRFVYQL